MSIWTPCRGAVAGSDDPGPTGINDAGYNFRSGRAAVESVEAAMPAAGVDFVKATRLPLQR
jgi:hypothetical protein